MCRCPTWPESKKSYSGGMAEEAPPGKSAGYWIFGFLWPRRGSPALRASEMRTAVVWVIVRYSVRSHNIRV